MTSTTLPASSLATPAQIPAAGSADFTPRYWLFSLPAVLIIAGVIVFPWLFTLYMSSQDWKIGGGPEFVGLQNFAELFRDARFIESMGHTFYFTVLAVVLPILFGTAAALVFHREFPFRGLLRTIFVMPMMATPVAVALVWTMMFHPQLGVLNYLLSLVGIGPQAWVYSPNTVIPTLILVEVWHWTPLVMLIVLGGLAGLPREPYESALIDGANAWHMFRHITLPLVWPFIMVAIVIRTIDALKAFDTIFVITQGGPGTASETLNIFLYLQAFQFYKIGYASAVVVIFFVIIIMLSLLLLYARQKSKWNA
ncbi:MULTISPECIES: sugar ABC transporter permease [unclassified Bosea (in: a-proteobacteria)]|uniref:carbohydrate ABC transporter permease n=1 Tax=unclassified Bosea (in: a-proteobacteria) TaxID=2653178 RepID=UPI000F75B09F|nr:MULTISPECIES: sugar ABC transporter permease [unclassified Bosea (in: a-proteobacteria)]AZO80101.1 ABC transporter permease [Bosea sp. Tri-49]MCV9936428.1 sugar ABC transporter permease [Boseaceae bacterium BT-24-1]RXT22888.1 ABC transporter permease [Bosea sp. Tri-39]RXT38357.1 ABC transporter permease [Bosea sp. Tri-54]